MAKPSKCVINPSDDLIQGKHNTAALAARQGVAEEEPPPMETCVGCFDPLSDDERSRFETALPVLFGPTVTTIEQLCTFLEGLTPEQLNTVLPQILTALVDLGVDDDTIITLSQCLGRVLSP